MRPTFRVVRTELLGSVSRGPAHSGLSLLLAVAMVGGAIACAAPDNGPPWAAEAEIWSTALLEEPNDESGHAFELFWDPNVAWDIRSMIGGAAILRGQNAFILASAMYPVDAPTTVPGEPVFVVIEGLVTTTVYDWEATSLSHLDASAPAHLINILDPIGARGAERQVSAMAIEDRRGRMFGRQLDEAEEVARGWLRGWTAGNDELLAGLYATDAVLRDSIGTTSVMGTDAIVALGSELAWPSPDLATLDGSSPALYPLITGEGDVRGVAMIVRIGSCPGDMAIVLEVEDTKIVTDTRYRSIDDARRCIPADQLPDGWWTGRTLYGPDEVQGPIENLESPTDSIAVGADWLVLCNSTPHLAAFTEWGITRFEVAGLEPPPISQLAFTTQHECCTHAQGRTSLTKEEYEVFLCLDEQTTCADDLCAVYRFQARHALLHEFAHVWLADNLTDNDRAIFTNRLELTAWNDQNQPWSERAVEHAAETIAWGLLDQPFVPIFIGSPSVGQLTEDFRFLTGSEPIQPEALSTG